MVLTAVAPPLAGRLLHRFAERDRLPQDAEPHQRRLRLRELLRQTAPQILRLIDERRNDDHADDDDDAPMTWRR